MSDAYSLGSVDVLVDVHWVYLGVFFSSLILFFMQSTPCWDFVWGHIDGLTNDAWLRILALLARQLVGIASEIQ
jgi:hypothetical protein